MTNCFTALHKRPKTMYNLTYVDWNEEVSKWRPPKPAFYTPRQPLWPLPPIKRFRPMPQPKDGEPEPDREKVHDCRGLKTPEPSFHLGYKHFHTDPSTKKLRQLDAEKPLSYPLITEFREQYQNPNHLPHLLLELSTTRFGLPADRQKPAIGIAPRTISIPYPDMDDDPTWQRDCNSYP